ncbi:hypothetical protein [Stieleria varia]|uniref:Uncharacterized protein n=1 Tax=Stieleria varia TaxID=2528005 RepID=A0A5C6ALX1_9BACT|nr:hypothetical protein [Stieleria varia]TWU01015.1 hypothetical protein Pla52n_43860 [Stieleria varia]
MRFPRLSFAVVLLLWNSALFAQSIDLSSVETLDLVANPPVVIKVDAPDDTLAIWAIIRGFDDPEVKRNELLRKSGKFVKDFPKSQHLPRAKEIVSTLRRMASEELPPESKPIERLIFLLRDQDGVQVSQPGSCDILFADRLHHAIRTSAPELVGEYNPSPAQRLIDIGPAAIPMLIEHVDDDTFTRSVGFHRDFYFSHHVLRVSDCVKTILQEIAPTGRIFEVGDDPAATKQAMKSHYRSIVEQIKANDSRTKR